MLEVKRVHEFINFFLDVGQALEVRTLVAGRHSGFAVSSIFLRSRISMALGRFLNFFISRARLVQAVALKYCR